MSAPDDSTEALLAERYGRRGTGSPRWVYAVGAVLVAGALAWLAWTAWVHSTPDVSGELAGYTVVSDHQVHVVIDAKRTEPDAVTCLVKALSDEHALVGEETVTIPAGATGSVRFEADVATDRLATTVRVSDCR